jgi:FkbM family methyltransferase
VFCDATLAIRQMHSSIVDISDKFAVAAKRHGPTRLSRFARSPIHLMRSKYLELYSKMLRVPVRRRVRTFWGDEMEVVFPERVSMKIYRYGFFERELTQFVLAKVKPGMVFFDVGAHFGYYSLLASTLVGAQGAVHSFEPTPSTYGMLLSNTSAKKNVTINNLAMWSNSTTIRLRDYGLAFSAFNSVEESRVQDNMRDDASFAHCEVHATSVDEYAAKNGVVPNFIKLDAEGAEPQIIQGMSETLRSARPLITLEVGDAPGDRVSKSRELLETILSLGYRLFEEQNSEIRPHQLLPRYEYSNILATPD